MGNWIVFKKASPLIILLLLVNVIPINSVGASDPWWNAQWSQKVQLTFDNSASSENLTDFPVMVYLNSSRVDWIFLQNDGDDLRFLD